MAARKEAKAFVTEGQAEHDLKLKIMTPIHLILKSLKYLHEMGVKLKAKLISVKARVVATFEGQIHFGLQTFSSPLSKSLGHLCRVGTPRTLGSDD